MSKAQGPSPRQSASFLTDTQPATKRTSSPASSRQRKRRCGSEIETPCGLRQSEKSQPAKQRRITAAAAQPKSDGSLPLTKYNLQRYDTLMDSEASDCGGSGQRRKRRASGTGSNYTRLESATTQSQKSRITAAQYRYDVLLGARIIVRHQPAPTEVRVQVDAIMKREITPERKRELSMIAQRLKDSFVETLGEAAGEDDCIKLFYNALSSMDSCDNFAMPQKAGTSPLPFSPCS